MKIIVYKSYFTFQQGVTLSNVIKLRNKTMLRRSKMSVEKTKTKN